MEWLDNLKEEIAWPYVQARNWFQTDDNVEAAWIIAIATAVVALFVYGGLFFGGRAIVRAVSTDKTITVVSGNPCLNEKGLVKAWAPSSCYVDGLARTAVQPKTEDERVTAMTRNNDLSVTPTNPDAYNPPCKKDGLPGCSDSIYGKRLLSGIIVTTTFHNDEKVTDGEHLQPDYTEVEIDPCNGDDCENVKEKFCGNVLDQYIPGRRLKLVLNESKQADYNGCYTTDVVTLTFGGDNYRPRRK
jgi:hypothetical protein